MPTKIYGCSDDLIEFDGFEAPCKIIKVNTENVIMKWIFGINKNPGACL